jgi:hypothetical protein
MWLFTTEGFYSVVQHRTERNTLVVRCRAELDATTLRDRLTVDYPDDPALPEVQHTPTADYGWRLLVPRWTFGKYLRDCANDIDYDNFKNAVAQRQGLERADIYHDVWSVMWEFQQDG